MNKKLPRLLLAILASGLLLGSVSAPAGALTGDPVLVGAGDIARCNTTYDEATARLLDKIPGTVFTLGDNAYPDGTKSQFVYCYGHSWGRHKLRTLPAAGNHDYHTAGASGYYSYFGRRASLTQIGCTSNCKGYYSYNRGTWHIIVLNAEIAHGKGSPQELWLRRDLAAHKNICTLAYWHEPLFSSGMHGNNSSVLPFWQALYQYKADVVLNGHDHIYERFKKQDPYGRLSANGIREFVVGTGGSSLYSYGKIQPNSVIRNNKTWGVLKLVLHAGSYSWRFVPIKGQTFSDVGSAVCVR